MWLGDLVIIWPPTCCCRIKNLGDDNQNRSRPAILLVANWLLCGHLRLGADFWFLLRVPCFGTARNTIGIWCLDLDPSFAELSCQVGVLCSGILFNLDSTGELEGKLHCTQIIRMLIMLISFWVPPRCWFSASLPYLWWHRWKVSSLSLDTSRKLDSRLCFIITWSSNC